MQMNKLLNEWRKFLKEDSGSSGSGEDYELTLKQINDLETNMKAVESLPLNIQALASNFLILLLMNEKNVSPESFKQDLVQLIKVAKSKTDDAKKLEQIKNFVKSKHNVDFVQNADYTLPKLKEILVSLKKRVEVIKQNREQAVKDWEEEQKDAAAAGKSAGASGSYVLAWVFPEYEPAYDQDWEKNTGLSYIGGAIRRGFTQVASGISTGKLARAGKCGTLGHAGLVLVLPSGRAILAEFGRYNTPKGYGKILKHDLGKLAKFNPKNGYISNAEDVAREARKYTYGEGPKMKMEVAVVKIPNENAKKVLAFISRVGNLEYRLVDVAAGGGANCGTFTYDAIASGDVDMPGIDAFVSAMPKDNFEDLTKIAIEKFIVDGGTQEMS